MASHLDLQVSDKGCLKGILQPVNVETVLTRA